MIDLIAGRYTVRAGFGAAFDADNLGGNMLGLGISLTRANLGVSVRNFDFTTGTLPAGVTFTRAGSATYFDANGVLQTAAADVPRFDHDPVTKAPKGLLIEGSRTNLLTYSDQFDNAAWSKVRTSLSPNSGAGGFGDLTADKIVEDTSNNSHVVGRNVSFTAGTSYTFSIEVAAAGRNQWSFIFPSTAFTVSRCIFDLTAVTAVVTTGVATASIVSIGGGRYRCTATATAVSTTSSFIEIRLASAESDTYTGDGTSGIYVWGAQIEAGAFASSYIPTTTAAATRAADQPRITANLGTRDVRVTTEGGVQVLTGQALTGSYWPALTGPQWVKRIEVL